MAKFREKGRQEIENYLEQATDESAFVGELIKKTFEEDALFISNSMPIRDIDNLLLNKNIDIYANRGANGIDGIVSTALGMAVHKRITLLIGDLSFYHDMNGLLMSKLNNIQMNIVLLNNDGGGIFHIYHKKKVQPTILNGCLAHRRDWISSIQLSYINSILNVLTVFQNLKCHIVI